MKTDKILLGTDTVSGIHPKILKAITIASKEKTLPYGNDIFTEECKSIIAKIFEKDDLVVFLAKREELKAVENIFSVGTI